MIKQINPLQPSTSFQKKRAICFDLQNKWDKVFKNGPNKICGRQPLKKQTIFLQIF